LQGEQGGGFKMLSGDAKTLNKLADILEKIGLEPSTNGHKSICKTKVFVIKTNGSEHSIRIFIDKETQVGTIKIKKTHQGGYRG
jgi:hypothetical protein